MAHLATDPHTLLGQSLGTCTIQSLIGRGGMGAVYLARQNRPRREVAVKVLLPLSLADQPARLDFLARFRREADAIAALDHVNIIPIYEYGEQEQGAYLVMPYITGGSLHQVLEKQGPLPLSQVLPILEQTAAALNYAHAKGIIHRDLKPANILFHSDGRVLLADFGLAKVLRGETDSHSTSALTSAGIVIGTPEYLSPEQAGGQELDQRSDIYALGILLFHMLSGRVPFKGATPVATAIQHAIAEPPSLSQLNPTISPAIEAVVMKTLAKQPTQRYESAGQLAQAFSLAAGIAPTRPPQVPEGSPPFQMHVGAQFIAPSDHASKRAPFLNAEDAMNCAPTFAHQNTEDAMNCAPTFTSQVSPQGVETPPERQPGITPMILRSEDSISEAHYISAHAAETVVDMLATSNGHSNPVVNEQQLSSIPVDHRPVAPKRRAGFPLWRMTIFGLILIFLLIASGSLAFLTVALKEPSPVHVLRKPSPASTATGSTVTPAAHLNLPPPAIPAGHLLYGTATPAYPCTSTPGSWSATANARITCSSSATELVNTHAPPLAGIFLNTLANGQPIPNDYILQVQVRQGPHSQGAFGVLFRNQPGSPNLGAFSFLLSSNSSWSSNVYYKTSKPVTQLYAHSTTVPLRGLITITVHVQGDTFLFYVNGREQGNAISSYYTGGTVGLALDKGADVFFSNFALYALPHN